MKTDSVPSCSVVMPAYNTAEMIGVAIESVLAQTRGDFELIIVDDGSTDGTAMRAEEYLCDSRVKLIRQPNSGQARARNTAIEAARGAYVSLLDSDDVWMPRYLEVMAGALDEAPAAAVAYTDAWVMHDDVKRIARKTAMSHHPPHVSNAPEQFFRTLLERGNFVFAGATIRLSTLAAVGPFRTGVDGSEDYEMWLRISARAYRFVRCPAPLVIYRRRPGQATSYKERMVRSVEEVLRIVEEEYNISDDLRALARQRLPVAAIRGPGQPRRVPRLFKEPYRALSRLLWFYVRPPRAVRAAFPDLQVL